ncbi:oxidoreductase [Rhypophila decipiens]|uniref:Oxidoreductase n=1 Tax=Rhypophila decipiens TaxID=261697 RepID=A0AAN6XZS3_9PEZI|nr:oxidoreductase [Rhypophila decipiens]
MSGLRVLIVGASIAGPTAAYWFAKAGASVTVIERFPHLRTNGQNIDIRGVGVTVMRRMPGMEPAVRSKLVPVQGITVIGPNGKSIGTITPTGNPDQQSLISEYEILRGDLSRILYDLSVKDHPNNVRYIFDETITAITQKSPGGSVMVEFANGHIPPTEFDLVVAADGATSRTRALALGCSVRDYMQPVNAWAAFFTVLQKDCSDLLEGSSLGHGYTAVGGRFVAIAPRTATQSVDPNNNEGGNRVTLMGIYPRSSPKPMASFREAVAHGETCIKKCIAEQFRGAGWKTDLVMDGMLDPARCSEFYAAEMVQLKPPTLFKGRIVLVGDAGYASGPTGMGTSLAMAGAYILAGEVISHWNKNENDSLDRGLKAYEERMRRIVDKMARIPPFIPGVLAPYTAWGLWLRNAVFRLGCWSKGALDVVRRVSSRATAFQALPARGKESDDVEFFPEYDFGEGDEDK